MFPGSTSGGLIPGPTTGNISSTDSSGLTQAQVQALIDTSLGGAVAPSSVTTSGKIAASGGFDFDTSATPDGQESSIEREQNGGMLLKRGGTTFLTLSPFTGATFGVNLTAAQNLTVTGTFTPSGGISGFYTTSQIDALLLQKQALLSDNNGTGVTLRDGTVMRRVFGAGGISVTVPLNVANANDPENFNLKLDGSALQTSIGTKADSSTVTALQSTVAGKQDAITSSSSLSVASLTAATDITASLIKAPASSSIVLGNSSATGVHVSSSGAVGILKVPTEALDVLGNCQIDGALTVNNPTTHTNIVFTNTNSLFTNLDVQAQGCTLRAYPHSGGAVLATNSAHSISLRANQFNYSTPGLVVTSTNAVVCNTTFTNNSDQALKSEVVQASAAHALEVLKAVEAKVYKRVDLPDNTTRIGFLAQDLQAALPPEWANIIGATEAVDGHLDQQGNEVPAKPSTLTLDYARLVTLIWQANRSMLARIEALEAAAAL